MPTGIFFFPTEAAGAFSSLPVLFLFTVQSFSMPQYDQKAIKIYWVVTDLLLHNNCVVLFSSEKAVAILAQKSFFFLQCNKLGDGSWNKSLSVDDRLSSWAQFSAFVIYITSRVPDEQTIVSNESKCAQVRCVSITQKKRRKTGQPKKNIQV